MKDDMNKELNTEQLDQVNGGVIGDSMKDSEVLYKLGILKEDIGFAELTFHWNTYSAKVDDAWSSIGITSVSHPASPNEYFYQGKSITQDEAIQIAKDLMIKGPKIKGIQMPF